MGRALAATTGTFYGAAISYSYQWQDCTSLGACTAIAGATGPSYELAASDVGYELDVAVTATNSQGSATVASAPTAAVVALPVPSSPAPVITGADVQGQALSTTDGTFSGSDLSYTYQWERSPGSLDDLTAIPGATSSTYVLAPADVGDIIVAVVTATNAAG